MRFASQKPEAVPVDPGRIPEDLKRRRQWVCWCYKYRKSKWTKPPCQPNARPAAVDDLATWSRFDDVLAAYKCGGFDGIGFVLTAGDPYVAIDLDHCRDPQTGKIEPHAQNIIHELASYSEVSPSATGIRIIATGKLPPRGRRKGRVEIYDDLRFVSLTGHCLPGTPTTIESRQAKIEDFHRAVFFGEQPARPRPTSLPVDDEVIVERARKSKNGTKFAALFDRGDWSGQGFPSQSESDASLCSALAFFSGGDVGAVDRLFRRSALMRKKWDRPDYRDRTIALALSQGIFYKSSRNGAAPGPRGAEAESQAPKLIELWADDPLKIAEAFIKQETTQQGLHTLHRWEEYFWEWTGWVYLKRTGEQQEAAVARFIYDNVILLKMNRAQELVACPPKGVAYRRDAESTPKQNLS
jgi:putative DNA primase/helicase